MSRIPDIGRILEAEAQAPKGYERDDLLCAPMPENARFGIDSLALDISGNCNMACRYCAEAATQPHTRPAMSSELLEPILSLLDTKSGRPTSLRFGSGEPMLNRELLHELHKKLGQRFPQGSPQRPDVFITTNGTLIDDSDIEWLASTGWHIKISFDGPEAVHDRWRVLPGGKGTHARVSATIAELARRIPELLSVTAVLAAGTDPAEVFASIEALGVRRIELVPALHQDPEICPDSEDILRFRTFIETHVDRLIDTEANVPTLVRLANRISRVMGYDNGHVQCGAGRNFFGIDHSGTLSPCFRFIGVERHRMGSLDEGADEEAAKRFQQEAGRPWNLREACRRCWAAPLCGGPCFAVTDLMSDGEPHKLECAFTLIESRGAWRLVDTLRRSDPECLLDYLPTSVQAYAQEARPDKTA